MKKILIVRGSLIIGYLVLATNMAYANKEVVSIEDNKIKTVIIQNQLGNISATGSKKPYQITFQKKKFDSSCKVTITKQGSTFSAIVEKKALNDTCEVDFDVAIPSSMNVVIANGMGDLSLKDIKGDVKYDIGTGNIDAENVNGQVTGHIGRGDITMKEMQGDINISGGQGNNTINFSPEFLKGDIKVSVGQGDITIAFPETIQLHAHLETGMGAIKNEFKESSSSPVKASLSTGMGRITIKKKSPDTKAAKPE